METVYDENNMVLDPKMPRYRCHKIVSALKIIDVPLPPPGAGGEYGSDLWVELPFAPVHVAAGTC